MATALNIIDAILSSIQPQTNEAEMKTEEPESRCNFKNYLAMETVGGAYFHPQQDHIVFVYNASGLYQVYECPVNPNQGAIWPQRLTYSDDRCTNPKYLSDGTIVYVSDMGGDEHFQMYLIDKQHTTHPLSTDLNAKHRLSIVTNKYLFFSANMIDKSKFDIYRQEIPLLHHNPQIICSGLSGIVTVSVVSPNDANIIIACHYKSNVHSEIILIDMNKNKLNNEQQTVLTAQYNTHQSTSIWRAIRFLDDQHLLCVTNYQCDYTRPVVLNIDTTRVLFFNQIESSVQCDYERFEFNDDCLFTYFTQNEHGYSVLYRCIFGVNKEGTQATIASWMQIQLPFKCVLSAGDQRSWTTAMSINSTNTLLAFTMSNSITPRNMFVLDLKNGMKCIQISNVSTPGIHSDQFVDSTLHSFQSFDDLDIHYFRYMPINDALSRPNGYPTIFVIHGGPESQYRPSFNSLIQFYLAAGFMIIAPNVRGSRGYGRTFMDKDNVEKRLDSVRDIKELSQHLIKNDENVDAQRLIVYGGSYGGFMVLSSITEYPDVFICGVDIVGISNFVTFLQNTADWRRGLRECEYGSLERDMDVLIKISPIHNIDRIQCPLFIIQGDNDERVPLSESLQIYEKLRDKKLNTKLLRFDDEGHGVTKLKNKIIAYGQVLAWLIDIVNDL
eukprot:765950_1